ncbi:TniQ family protein [Variovorax sp. ZS18.2.2]|nr:TniQ family protein [Variovorax sp. ZS18.2.2]
MKQELFGVCEPEFDESPSSWLSRAAASQAMSLRELCRWLEIPYRRDMDAGFCNLKTRQVEARCGLRPRVFDFPCRMLRVGSALRTVRPALWSERGRSRYRFCPKCFEDQHTPYLPVHWRFDPWRLCFKHRCMMEDACWKCHMPILLPEKMEQGGADGKGITFMSQCFHCSELLWRVAPIYVDQLAPLVLSPLQEVQLQNGCAFVSAIAHGYMTNLLGRAVRIAKELPLMERMQLLASGDSLSPNAIRQRELLEEEGWQDC